MQPDQAEVIGVEARRWSPDAGRFAVGSRRRALDRLRAAFEGGVGGRVLITGEAGAGKSWLVRRFSEGLPTGWRSAEVALSAALDGLETLRLVGGELGLEVPDRLGAARLALGAGLRDDSAEGRNWLLVVDEAQRASAGARDEIRVLSSEAGRAGGFAAIILVGRTELVRALAARPRGGWSSHLGLHIHLPPLDLDEARELLDPEGHLGEPELERIHRDALGNAGAMLRIAGQRRWASGPAANGPPAIGRPAVSPRSTRPIPRVESAGGEPPVGIRPPDAGQDPASPRLPSLIPSKPPIRVEDGLVEVGWEGDLEAEPTRPEDSPTVEPEIDALGAADPNEELVEDRYAALQAWAEWSRNRDRSALAEAQLATDADEGSTGGGESEPRPAGPLEPDSAPLPLSPVRAEPPHDFAPYSQLFTRLRHSL